MAYGVHTKFGTTPSLAKSYFLVYIYIHIRFSFSDPDVTVSHYFYQFLLWELPTCLLHRTTVYYYVIKIATVHKVTRCLISTLKFTTLSDFRQRIRLGQVLSIMRKFNRSHSCVFSSKRQDKVIVESRTSKRIIFHTYWEDEKLAYFASPTTRTHEYSWRKSDLYLWPVRRRLHNWPISGIRIDQSETETAAALCQISDHAAFLVDIARFS